MKAVVSHRERVLLALDRKKADRIPIAMVCSGINSPAREKLEAKLKSERGITLAEYLDPLLDIETLNPPLKAKSPKPGYDIWGVHRSSVPNAEGGAYDEIDFHPLASCESPSELETHEWPSCEIFDYEALPWLVKSRREKVDRCLMASNGNVFESSWYMRGFENMLMDFALNPEFAHALLDKVCEFYIEHFTRILQAVPGEIDLVFTADDIAGQNGLLMSLEMWEEFIKPRHVRLNKRIHELGSRVIYHSDGAVTRAIPGLIDMGIDVLQALQFDAAGMDPVEMKRLYGDRLCFEGGVSVQSTLPFGTPENVRDEAERLARVLGEGGGYILGPSHVIQAGTPPENIEAFFDLAAKLR